MDPRIAALISLLDRHRANLQDAYETIPRERRDLSPVGGGWSPDQVVEHLVETERSITQLLSGFVSQAEKRADDRFDAEQFSETLDMPSVLDRSKKVKGRDPAGQLDGSEAWRLLKRSREGLVSLLEEAQGARLEEFTYPHPATGEALNAYQWVAFLALHEGRHADQIRTAKFDSA